MPTTKTYNFKTQKRGDTFKGLLITYQDGTETAIDITGATIACKFRYGSKTGSIVADLSIGSGITVNDAVNGIFQIDQIDELTWAAGEYFYDVEITFSSGLIRTYLEGKKVITQDVT